MQITVNSRHATEPSVQAAATERLRFGLRRLSTWVHRADVDLADTNGPKGGQDKHCRLQITTSGSGLVVVSARADEWLKALNTAIVRAARQLVRLLKRPRSMRQSRARKAVHSRWTDDR